MTPEQRERARIIQERTLATYNRNHKAKVYAKGLLQEAAPLNDEISAPRSLFKPASELTEQDIRPWDTLLDWDAVDKLIGTCMYICYEIVFATCTDSRSTSTGSRTSYCETHACHHSCSHVVSTG